MYCLISAVLFGQVCYNPPVVYTQPVYVQSVHVQPIYVQSVQPVCAAPADHIVFNGVVHTRSYVCGNFKWGSETIPLINGFLPDITHHRDACGNITHRTYTYDKRNLYCPKKYGTIVNYDPSIKPRPQISLPPHEVSPRGLVPVNPKVEQNVQPPQVDHKIEPPLPFLRYGQ